MNQSAALPLSTSPPRFADLIEVAYKKERVSSRRLAKKLGISEEDALRIILEERSAGRPLSVLLDERHQELIKLKGKIAASKHAKACARSQKITAMRPAPDAWLAWFDGSTHPNPGKMGIGGLLKNPNGDLVSNVSFAAGQGDSSIAEYLALIAILQAAVDAGPAKLVVYGDSRVVLDDLKSEMGGTAILAHYRARAQQLAAQLRDVRFVWIPRHKNGAADALSQQAVKLPAMNQAAAQKITLLNSDE